MYWLTWPVTYHTCDLPSCTDWPDLTCDLPHMHVTYLTFNVLTQQTSCTDWPDMWPTTHACDLPDLMCWFVRLHVLTDLSWHVTYHTCDLPAYVLTHQTSCTDWSDLTCDLPHMWLTWPYVLICKTVCADWLDLICDLPHMWLTWPHVLICKTACADWLDLTCDLPHMWLTWPHVLICKTYCWFVRYVLICKAYCMCWLTWPHMWFTTHVTYLTSCIDL